ncbi:MAG TPA: carbohydrate ABC transporter permease [Acetobacteraceae bacterium]|jgi:ABC-type glycerol-3-phosphate transport system permease component|nr:carbohydrate ABC transporter permease [Acetobacteraceae bacterium]
MKRFALYAAASVVSLVFVYPFVWMVVNAFRTQEAILSAPLRLLPESLNLDAFRSIAEIGGSPISGFIVNSVLITLAATAIGVCVTGLGAYALYRQPKLPLFSTVRYSFLLTIMYPNMMLVIPLYFVVYELGLLGTYAGIILSLSLVPLLFFVFVQFFRTIPADVIEAAHVDGASEWDTFRMVVLPLARPVVVTATLVAFLLNWKQWFPVLVLSTTPDSYTLPVALVSLNSEYGINFQATMALATLTVLPVVVLFLITQRRVIDGIMTGAVKG